MSNPRLKIVPPPPPRKGKNKGGRPRDPLREVLQPPANLHRPSRAGKGAPQGDALLPLPVKPPRGRGLNAIGRRAYRRFEREQDRFRNGEGTRAFLFESDIDSVVDVCLLYQKWWLAHSALEDSRSGKAFDLSLFQKDQASLQAYMKARGALGYDSGMEHIDLAYQPIEEDEDDLA